MAAAVGEVLPYPVVKLPHTPLVIAVLVSFAVAGPTAAQTSPGRIAFTRVREDVRQPGDYRFEAEIWLMESDGTKPRRLTTNRSDDFGISWAPDGKAIVFGATQFARDTAGKVVPVSQHIYSLVLGGAPVLISPVTMRAQFPNWSLDGKRIVFHGHARNVFPAPLGIFVMNSDGSQLRSLTNDTFMHVRPDWSPDGQRLVFQSNRDGNPEIYVMRADGSDVVQITHTARGIVNNAPDWSPDGQRIVFVSDRDGNLEIYTMRPDGSEVTRLTNDNAADVDPEWSSDGTMIIFDRDVQFVNKVVPQLFIMRSDGTGLRAMTGLPSSSSHAAWSRFP